MYDTLSSDYDRFVNWQGRLALELPFILEQLKSVNARDVLDAACGTGMHAIALAQRGYRMAGSDLSRGMIERAQVNTISAAVQVRFEIAGFGALANTFGRDAFDALLCLGNSLPHLLTPAELASSLADFASCLRPGGQLLIQNRNFDAVMAHHERWMEPQSHQQDDMEWIFQRFYDFDPDGLLTFNMVTLKREGQGNWNQQVVTSRLRPLIHAEIVDALSAAGFLTITSFGNMAGAPFDPASSGNLVLTASLSS
jgi:glycine/sarcosine N-methyltransferase